MSLRYELYIFNTLKPCTLECIKHIGVLVSCIIYKFKFQLTVLVALLYTVNLTFFSFWCILNFPTSRCMFVKQIVVD